MSAKHQWILISFDSFETMFEFMKKTVPKSVKPVKSKEIKEMCNFPYEDDKLYITHTYVGGIHSVKIIIKNQDNEENR